MDENHDFSDDEYDYPDNEPKENWIYNMMDKDYYKPISIVKDKKAICVRKVKQPNGKYKKCKKTILRCNWCYKMLCPSPECIPQYHEKCLYCDNITCCIICEKCEVNHRYDMITENVAIGSYQASYEPFDIVINLDYPHNKVEKNKVIEYIVEKTYVIACGYEDSINQSDSLSVQKINDLLAKIENLEKDGPKKILFHCYAGVSRSATLAISYLAKYLNKSTEEVYQLIKDKRPRINPNSFFKKLLNLN